MGETESKDFKNIYKKRKLYLWVNVEKFKIEKIFVLVEGCFKLISCQFGKNFVLGYIFLLTYYPFLALFAPRYNL